MITIKNFLLWSPAFTESFKHMMKCEGLEPKDKLSLVRLRKSMITTMEEIVEANDNELMKEETGYDIEKFKLTDSLAAHLTAEDIFNLEPLLEE